jgi:hypothetical protein
MGHVSDDRRDEGTDLDKTFRLLTRAFHLRAASSIGEIERLCACGHHTEETMETRSCLEQAQSTFSIVDTP